MDPSQSKHVLLRTLRKVDCYRLDLNDLMQTGLAAAVATLAAHSPRLEVSKLAAAILDKWKGIIAGGKSSSVAGKEKRMGGGLYPSLY
jgi:hypothetical protein